MCLTGTTHNHRLCVVTETTRPWLAVGKRIRSLRLTFDLTQETLGRKCHVSQAAVSQWERGVKLPARRTQYLVADVLRTTRAQLFREAVEVEQAQEMAA